jgi:hypothetical protein
MTIPWGVPGVDLGANTYHDGKLYFFFGDVPLANFDLVAYTTDAAPGLDGIHLTPVLGSDGKFSPFQILLSGESQPAGLPGDQTPTGAFSYGGQAYVFINYQPPGKPYASYLTPNPDPSSSTVFEEVFLISVGDTGRFFQAAPMVVQNSTISGLPSDQGDGLIIFGNDHSSGVFLAWMPLYPGLDPNILEIRYWTKIGWSEPDADPQQNQEPLAIPLFDGLYWTSFSVGRIPELGLWILLSQTAVLPQDDPTVAATEQIRGKIVARSPLLPGISRRRRK